jgi:hypothetical protein
MGLSLSRVRFVQVVQIVQNVFNGLSVLNSIPPSSSPSIDTVSSFSSDHE